MPAKDPARARAATKKYKETHPERVAAAQKKYQQTHKEEIRAKKAIYRDANRERINAYSRAYAKANRNPLRAWYNEYKAKHPCIYCGETCVPCLDFHHRNPEEKDSNISILLEHYHAIDEVLAEIAKCDVVCKNCHAKIHAGLLIERE